MDQIRECLDSTGYTGRSSTPFHEDRVSRSPSPSFSSRSLLATPGKGLQPTLISTISRTTAAVTENLASDCRILTALSFAICEALSILSSSSHCLELDVARKKF
ncbi:hypothetical protein MLD38_020185 [Melastoma candidum]|uniref:Uncharacterized protein n=1 Tax=Melastoma candidum TaxID=119954 RepID=A0ACB9QF45_9MYRT|nr:hypothetical protein MLD38_020185 [Melastoma candidum]